MPKSPKISVILPVYNGEDYLRYALDSILDQTYKDFELILVNDGSTDKTRTIVDEYAKKDDRVVPIHQKNIGLVATLNKAISLSKGKYIARMDADDISLPRRFAEQISLLEANKNSVLCGSCFDVINEFNEFIRLGVAPAFDEDLKRSMRLYNPIAHGSVMFKREAFLKTDGYSSTVGPTEDYDLWMKLSELGEFVFSEKSLFRWRVNPEGITHSANDTMQDATRELVYAYRQENPVLPYTSKKMRLTGRKYIDTYGSIGVIMKEIVLEDNYNLGIKSFKEGHRMRGLKFIISVALTGRIGLKIATNRTIEYTAGRLKPNAN